MHEYIFNRTYASLISDIVKAWYFDVIVGEDIRILTSSMIHKSPVNKYTYDFYTRLQQHTLDTFTTL